MRSMMLCLPTFVFLVALAAPAIAREPSSDEVLKLHAASADSTRSDEAVRLARGMLATDLDPTYVAFVRQMLVQSLIRGKAAPEAIASSADSLELALSDAHQRIAMLAAVGQVLLDRKRPDLAVKLARRAYAQSATGDAFARDRTVASAVLGRAHLAAGKPDSALTALTVAAAGADSTAVFGLMGRAHEARGDAGRAIDAYVRALGTFPVRDTSALVPLRALYVKTHGKLDGLDARLATARRAARRATIEKRRHNGVAPAWSLEDFEGRSKSAADFPGKVLVLDFWGSWCGPCRAEMPHVQRAYEQYKDRGVAFVGINWERNAPPDKHRAAAEKFLREQGFTFPNVLDYRYEACRAFGVTAFPSLFVIDGTGRIRYRNVGFDPSIGDILMAQIEEVLEGGAP